MKGTLNFLKTDRGLYFLSFLYGFGVYSLKLVSLSKIINSLSISAYPYLMLAAGFSIFGFSKLNEALKAFNIKLWRKCIFILPVILLSISYIFKMNGLGNGEFESVIFFLFSISLISSLDVIVRSTISTNSSILKNSRVASQVSLFEELGTLLNALLTLLVFSAGEGPFRLITNIIPFIIMYGVYFFYHDDAKYKVEAVNTPNLQNNLNDKLNFKYPYTKIAIVFFSIVLTLKQLQGFAVFLGLYELNSSGQSVEKIFSYLTTFQTLAIISILFLKGRNKGQNTEWSKGFDKFFGLQGLLFAVYSLLPLAPTYLFGGFLRKIVYNSFLTPSQNMLNANYPKEVAESLRQSSIKYGNFLSYGLVAILSFAVVNKYFHVSFIWGVGVSLTILGSVFRKKLFKSLSQFNLSMVVSSNIREAEKACYSFGVKEGKIHTVALIKLLEVNADFRVVKSVIHSLGQIGDARAIEPLIASYYKYSREDIQITVIKSLLNFKSHHVDLFLLDCLEEIILTQRSLGEIRSSLFEAITSRIRALAIPMLLRIVKNSSDDERILANVVLIMGNIALNSKDRSLMDIVFGFSDTTYPRRIKSNALIFLLQDKIYGSQALERFEAFLTSADDYDSTAATFIIGELKMIGMAPYVLEQNHKLKSQNSTVLISLLKLEYPGSEKMVADFIMSSSGDQMEMVMNQLNGVNEAKARYKVYAVIIRDYRQSASQFIKYLELSNRDFDADRQVIYGELERLGHVFQEDNSIISCPPKIEIKEAS